MSAPISLRNIAPQALRIAHHLSEQTGLSLADLLRQAVVSGLLVEATRFAPQQDGTLGGCDPASLAKALRRHLSSAIDLLIEYGEHPHQEAMMRGEKSHQRSTSMPVQVQPPGTTEPLEAQSSFFEHALGDDVEMLWMGMGFAAMVESEDTLSKG